MIEITVNGESRNVPAEITLSGLLKVLDVKPERVAIELDRSIIRQNQWDSTLIQPGAKLEIVQFVGGG